MTLRILLTNRVTLLIKLIMVTVHSSDSKLALISLDNLLTLNSLFQVILNLKEERKAFGDDSLIETVTQKFLLIINARIVGFPVSSINLCVIH